MRVLQPLSVAACAAVVAVACSTTSADTTAPTSVATADPSTAGSAAPPDLTPDDTLPPRTDGPIVVVVAGDSVALQFAEALDAWGERNPGRIEVVNQAHLGCGTTRGGSRRYELGDSEIGWWCDNWALPIDPAALDEPTGVSWITAVEANRPDVVVTRLSGWDSIDRLVPALGATWRAPGDPVYDAYVHSEYADALDVLTSTGGTLAWVTAPDTNHPGHYSDPARMARMADIVDPLVDALPRSTVVDLRSFLGPAGGPRDVEWRPDGSHFANDKLGALADWMAPQIIAAGEANRASR